MKARLVLAQRALCAMMAAAWVAGAGAAQAAPLTATQQLGKMLFFDKHLSHGGNQACGSCHAPAVAFTDPDKTHATSKGDNPALFGNRNAPSASYMAYSPPFHYDADEGTYVGGQFDDGRASSLEDQAKAPFLNPVEMGNASRADVVSRLMTSPEAGAFTSVYGPNAFADTDTAYDNIAAAIAAYERSSELSPFSSKFDVVQGGHAHFTDQELRGYKLFTDPAKGNCSACHISDPSADGTPALFTDFTYDNIGIPKNYHSDFLTDPPAFNPAGQGFLDCGLGAIVGDPSLCGAFKVTTLRNIAITGPYGHNGFFDSLDEIVDFYATRDVKPACVDATVTAAQAEALGCWPAPEFPDTMNMEELGDLNLSSQDKADIVAFLGTLTDGYAVPEPSTWALAIVGFAGVGAALRRRRPKSA
jgi:cytochrome c peroxidase